MQYNENPSDMKGSEAVYSNSAGYPPPPDFSTDRIGQTYPKPDAEKTFTSEAPPEETTREENSGASQDRGSSTPKSPTLERMLKVAATINERATKPVVFSPPLLTREGFHIIGRSTVNVIQGGEGAHKSRLAETMLATLLAPEPDTGNLGFERPALERFACCYGDSERNLKEEVPAAIQAIKRLAGIPIDQQPPQLYFFSLKPFDRKQRLEYVKEYLMYVRQQTTLHMVAIIDVATDFVSSFNDEEQAMAFYDFLGNLCDDNDCTIFLVIHQNPGSEKARGHVGTEGANKGASVLQIGYDTDGRGNETGLIKLRFKKIRRGPKPPPVFLRFDREMDRLVVADSNDISNRTEKANTEDVADKLTDLLANGPVQKSDLVNRLADHFDTSDRTIRDRLNEIKANPSGLFDAEGKPAKLTEFREGKAQFYKLETSV